MLTTSVFTDIIVKKATPVEKSFSAVSNVPLVQPAIKLVRTSLRNDAIDLTRHLTCAMDAQKQSTTAPLLTSIAMTLSLLIVNTKNVSPNPEPA